MDSFESSYIADDKRVRFGIQSVTYFIANGNRGTFPTCSQEIETERVLGTSWEYSVTSIYLSLLCCKNMNLVIKIVCYLSVYY